MPKRVLQGVVVSDKQNKTIVVKVERRFTHPVLKKTVRRSKNYHAHDEANTAKIGDVVQIAESRPISKLKTWTLVGEVEKTDGEGGIISSVADAVTGTVSAAFDLVKSVLSSGDTEKRP
jgi:small subunit ribosomal protein S17